MQTYIINGHRIGARSLEAAKLAAAKLDKLKNQPPTIEDLAKAKRTQPHYQEGK